MPFLRSSGSESFVTYIPCPHQDPQAPSPPVHDRPWGTSTPASGCSEPGAFVMPCCSIAKSCRLFCNPMDCGPPRSSVHEIFQARILAWVAISFSRRSSWSRDWTRVSCIVGGFFICRTLNTLAASHPMPLSCSHLLEAWVQLPLTEVCDFSDRALLFLNLLVGLSVPFRFQSPFNRMNLSLGQKQKVGPSHCGDAQHQTSFRRTVDTQQWLRWGWTQQRCVKHSTLQRWTKPPQRCFMVEAGLQPNWPESVKLSCPIRFILSTSIYIPYTSYQGISKSMEQSIWKKLARF